MAPLITGVGQALSPANGELHFAAAAGFQPAPSSLSAEPDHRLIPTPRLPLRSLLQLRIINLFPWRKLR